LNLTGCCTNIDRSRYAINVFVPLVDISVENGGTEFWLGTHRLGAHAPSSGGSSGSLLRVTLLPVLAC
jgi:hypothetical protein